MAVASLRPQDSNNRDDSARMIFCLNGLPSRDEGCYRDQVSHVHSDPFPASPNHDL